MLVSAGMATSGDCSVSQIEMTCIYIAGCGDLPMGDGELRPEVLEGERDASLIGEFRRLPQALIISWLAFLWCSKPVVITDGPET